MATVSVFLTPELERNLDFLVREGVAFSKADAMRRALEKFAEGHAIEVVLTAERKRPFGVTCVSFCLMARLLA